MRFSLSDPFFFGSMQLFFISNLLCCLSCYFFLFYALFRLYRSGTHYLHFTLYLYPLLIDAWGPAGVDGDPVCRQTRP